MFWKTKERDWNVKSKYIIPANIVFVINVLTRLQGVFFLGITGIVYLKKIVNQSDSFCKIFKYVFYTGCLIVLYLLAFSTPVLWKPYMMHCETKLDRTDAIPEWCIGDKVPNIFNHI